MKIIFVLLLFLFVFSISASTFIYLEGEVSIMNNREWYEVFIGDEANNDDVIKLGKNSLVEIASDGDTIILNKQGVYDLKDILVYRAITFNIFKKFMAKDVVVQTAAMGVRGSATETDSMDWMMGEDEVIDEVKELIEFEDYEEAISILEEEIDFAEDINLYHYYLGYSYYMMGKMGPAFSNLNEVEHYKGEEYHSDFVIMVGSLLINSMEYNQAIHFFKEYLLEDNYSSEAQIISLLTSITLQYLGKDNQARERLIITIKMNKDSDTGKNAQRMFEALD